jgi:aflatoxin B1 aldehyde reductase
VLGQVYQQIYFDPSVLELAHKVALAAEHMGIDGHAVALRWTVYHSALSTENGDAVVLGASSVEQMQKNLDAIDAGPLPEELLRLVEDVGEALKGRAALYHL